MAGSVAAHVGEHRVLVAAPDRDGEALARRGFEHHAEMRGVAGEDRVAPAGPQLQVREVAPGVQHRHAAHRGEEEGEEEAERQRVVDGGEEEHQQDQGEGVALLRGEDEDPPLDERDRRRLRRPGPEDPVRDRLPQVGEHRPGALLRDGDGREQVRGGVESALLRFARTVQAVADDGGQDRLDVLGEHLPASLHHRPRLGAAQHGEPGPRGKALRVLGATRACAPRAPGRSRAGRRRPAWRSPCAAARAAARRSSPARGAR